MIFHKYSKDIFNIMKVVKIDFENKTFFTEDGVEYPLMFGINKNITLDEFQKILDNGEDIMRQINDILNG